MGTKPAVIVVDMLNEFITGNLAFDIRAEVIPNLRRLVGGARAAGVPVIYACDAHHPSDPEIAIWGEHAMAGTEAAEVIPELAPQAGDHVVPSRTYSAFQATTMDELLSELGIDSLILAGVHTHICVQHSAADAFFRGYPIEVVSDCVDAFSPAAHEHGLDYVQEMYGAELVSSDEVLARWKEAAA